MSLDPDQPLIILLAGPTAAGKTSLSLELAKELGTEIVNADSMQVYRYMDIGAAKPTPSERAAVPHRLLDVIDPDEPFDAARYAELAGPAIDELQEEGKIPLVVGGTGLYMKVLTKGICAGPSCDPAIRAGLVQEANERGLAALHAELLQADPVSARRIHPNDRQRILRALEVYRATGEPLSRRQDQHGFQETLRPSLKIFLHRDRDELYDRIDRRVRLMVEQGFLAEVSRLLEMGFSQDLKPMQAIGYKQMTDHLLGRCSLEEAVRDAQVATRRYAKRQMTWFRGDPEFHAIHAENRDEIMKAVKEAIKERGSGASNP